jgi:hypothetical protein
MRPVAGKPVITGKTAVGLLSAALGIAGIVAMVRGWRRLKLVPAVTGETRSAGLEGRWTEVGRFHRDLSRIGPVEDIPSPLAPDRFEALAIQYGPRFGITVEDLSRSRSAAAGPADAETSA